MASVATTIIVHVIGLAVLSRQFGPQRGPLQALLPLVSAHKPHQHARARADHPQDNGIEPHTAIVLFPASSYVAGHGWTRTPFPGDNQWQYIELHGDQVTFHDSAAAQDDPGNNNNQARALAGKTATPVGEAVDQPLVIDDIGLPSLSHCFPDVRKLKADYRPPDFKGAAAVFTFPAGVEKAKACSLDPTNKYGRTDTQVKFRLYGDLIISTTNRSPQKDLVLRGAGKVIVGNLPTHILTGGDASGYSDVHYEVYAQMGEGTSGDTDNGFLCGLIVGVSLCEGTPSPVRTTPRGGKGKTTSAGSAAFVIPPDPPKDPDFPATDFRCSNTQWP